MANKHETASQPNLGDSSKEASIQSESNEPSVEASNAASDTTPPPQDPAQSTNKSRRHAKRATKATSPAPAPASSAPNTESSQASTSTINDNTSKKQRRELDVMNRLRWDERFSTADIIIGYEDRHSERGIIEIAFEAWEGELTADEFVPLHRIRYFRRSAGEGGGGFEFLWHRALRIDRVFGPR